MKMQKRVLTFLMTLMMVLGLAACGDGGGASAAGVYKVTKMSSEGIEMTTEEMSELFGMEVDMTLELKDDNTFVLDLGFGAFIGSYGVVQELCIGLDDLLIVLKCGNQIIEFLLDCLPGGALPAVVQVVHLLLDCQQPVVEAGI